MLTDYHVHLREDDLEATPAAEFFTAENVARYREAADDAGVEELGGLGAHPPVRRRPAGLGPPVLA
jgi:hypothetical protein